MSDLKVFVKKAEINHTDDKISSFILLKLGNYVKKSESIQGLAPEWNETVVIKKEFILSNTNIAIEVWSKGLFWDKLLGALVIPITTIRQSDKRLQGEMLGSSSLAKDGLQNKTKHKIWLDAEFVSSVDATLNNSESISSENSESLSFIDSISEWIARILHGKPSNASNERNAQMSTRSGWIEVVSNNSKDQGENSLPSRTNEVQEEINQLFSDIEKTPRFDARRRTSILIIERPITSQKASSFKNFSLQDEQLKTYVYKKSLQAILSPPSDSAPHAMEVWEGSHVSNCFECQGFLWVVGNHKIVRCRKCGLLAHDTCRDLLSNDCKQSLLREKEESSDEPSQEVLERQMNKGEILRQVFKVDPTSHIGRLEEAKKAIIDGSSNWIAKITIKVVCAKGLVIKDKSGTSDPYVTIQVGKIKKRSKTIHQDINPVWNESFHFICTNSSDRIKIRVWDQDRNFQSTMKTLITRSCADEFLGQKIIDTKSIVGESDLWYTLDKRGKGSTVSGSIRLNITSKIKGEEAAFPCHMQYLCLHEKIFEQLLEDGTKVSNFPIPKDGSLRIYFDNLPQEIVDEFAESYGIESIFRALTHFSCLCGIHTNPEVPLILNNLLDKIRAFYEQTFSSTLLIRDHLNSSNFGDWDFMKILDHLYNCLKINLSSYRSVYPSNESKSSWHLESSLKLFINIGRFKEEFQDGDNEKQEGVLKECMKACLETTYGRLFNNCTELYEQVFVSRQKHVSEEGPGCKRNLEFWYKLVALITSTIEEDSTFYSKIFNKFQIHRLEELSSSVLWESFTSDLQCILEEHLLESHCKNHEYVNFHNCVNELYNKFIIKSKPTTQPPHYPLLFEPFIKRWLKDNKHSSISFATSAFQKDKKGQYQKVSELSLFSSSVTDVFSLLNECYSVVSIFIQPHPLVGIRYTQAFSMTIEMVLMTYSILLLEDFPSRLSESEIACRLMNNIHQLRVELEKLFILMGGEEIPCVYLFTNLQRRLRTYHHELVTLFCSRLRNSVDEKIFEMRRLLAKQNISSSLFTVDEKQMNSLAAEANKILSPLVSYLDVTLSQFAKRCDGRVLRRILKELWKLTLKDIEYLIILPPLIRNGKSITGEKVDHKIMRHLRTPICLTPGQCLMLDVMLDNLKAFFWANNNGLRMKYLERNSGYLSLKDVLCLCSQTTDVLIKVFIDSQSNQIPEKLPGGLNNKSVGYLSLQVKVAQLAADYKVTIQVLAVEDINWPISSSIFQPFVEISVLGPHMSKRKRSHSTKCVANSWSPEYNETFSFLLGKASALEFYEVHFCLKDYCFIREDILVGISVFQLKMLTHQMTNNIACRLPLKSLVHVDHIGDMIVRILAKRTNDQTAKHFINLKTNSRKKLE